MFHQCLSTLSEQINVDANPCDNYVSIGVYYCTEQIDSSSTTNVMHSNSYVSMPTSIVSCTKKTVSPSALRAVVIIIIIIIITIIIIIIVVIGSTAAA